MLIKSPVEELSKVLDGISLDSISVQIALREHYETYYHLFDHNQPSEMVPPLAIVTLHPKERYDHVGRYARLAANFIHYGIKDTFGYNFSEFLELTRAQIDILLEIASVRKKKTDLREEKLARSVQQAAAIGQ